MFTLVQLKLLQESFGSQDYGSRYMNLRNEVNNLRKQINELEKKLQHAAQSPDLRDFESDKDPSGGARYIIAGIRKLRSKLNMKQLELTKLGEVWRASLGEGCPSCEDQ